MTCDCEVASTHKAMECDMCEKWEHMACVKERDRLEEELYDALVRCRSKSLLYVCSQCRKKGSIAKRFVCNELELARVQGELSRATDERLASARQIESQGYELTRLREEIESLKIEKAALTTRVQESSKESVEIKTEEPTGSSSDVDDQSSDHSDEVSGNTRHSSRHISKRHPTKQPHPPGFREMKSRVQSFSGKKGEDDFQLWLEDYEEASKDCQWSDQDRAKWFSWFITGPAKLTWQRTLSSADKASWERIVTVYKGQYGVHLNPRTAYQRCHELSYAQFGSAQGLVEAMRDYQRMAPTKLTDETLESILWNKAPVELQKEVGKIPDGSVQELLQRFLRAEVLVERKRRNQHSETTRKAQALLRNIPPQGSESERDDGAVSRKPKNTTRRQGVAEAPVKHVKCFKCHQLGHIAAKCPTSQPNKEPTRRITTTTGESEDLWVRVGVVTTERNTASAQLSGDVGTTGPTYKVDVTVEGLKTRALVDNGSQVSLIRTEMLPKLKELNNWTMEECNTRTHKMVSEPVGAGGQVLGARKIVVVSTMLEATAKTLCVPYYVLDSDKPLWQGAVKNCGLVLGTNAIPEFGIKMVHSNGEIVHPTSKEVDELKQVARVILSQVAHLGPRETQEVKVEVVQPTTMELSAEMVGIVVPAEQSLAEQQCDFAELLWRGEPNFKVKLNNWGLESQTLIRGHELGFIEVAHMIGPEDPIWSDSPDTVSVRVCQNQTEASERKQALQEKLQVSDNCSMEERKQLVDLLLDLDDVFALCDHELGETNLVTHNIDTGDAKPVQTSPRRLPYALRKELEEEMANLLATGCIEPSTSPYASALVLVRKKGGGLRVCVDYRGVNKDTVMDKYPIPRIDELIDMVGRRKPRIFTSLDLMRGYHQVRMADDSRHKTAFVCHMGLYQFRRMPFGLTNAPATFQRLMNQLFSGKEWEFVSVYLDDVLIASQSMNEHVEHIKKVLLHLKEAGLRLKPSKCTFATEEIEYLGHTLTPEGVRPNSKKVEAVSKFPKPKNVKEVKSFLGLANFYKRHIPDMAVISRPLAYLTKKNIEFNWTSECETAFMEVKQRLVSAPVLKPPDLSKPFLLWTDASERGFGAVLEQEDTEGQRFPIAYASRATNEAERKYAPTELEVAAVVFALDHFCVYLLGNKVKVYVDHQALVSAFIPYMKSQTKGILARWYLRLSQYLPNVTLEYKPGNTNKAADALSRAPVGEATAEQEESPAVLAMEAEVKETMMEKVRHFQRSDKELAQLMDYLEKKCLPEEQSDAKRVLAQSTKGFYITDGVLYFENPESSTRRKLVVPTDLRNEILRENHEAVFAGHFALKKMLSKLSQYYYWPGMRADVQKVCENCVVCASTQGQEQRKKPPLHCIPVGEPFECVGMDFKELDVSEDGNRYALVFQDYLTKWPEVFSVPDRTAPTVAKCLAELVWRHGVPAKIIHDRAAEFLSDVLQDTAAILGLKQLPTSGGHPQTDGLVERFNRTLKTMLTKLVEVRGKNWDKLLGPVLLAYRTTPHSSSGETPFFLMYGRDCRLPTGLDFYSPSVQAPTIESDYGRELFLELKKARQLAKENINKAQIAQKTFYDKEACSKVKIKEGDLVMLKVEPRFKLDRSFRGPYRVYTVTVTCAHIRPVNKPDGELITVSLQRLSRCRSRDIQTAQPWMGHGKTRKRRQLRRNSCLKQPEDNNSTAKDKDVEGQIRMTRRGRQVRKPARYCLLTAAPKCQLLKKGEVVRQSHVSE